MKWLVGFEQSGSIKSIHHKMNDNLFSLFPFKPIITISP